MAARKFLTPIDLTLLEIRNAIAHLLASAPGSPVEGQIYYNTTTHTFSFYNGTAWIVLGTLDQITAPAADVSLNSHKITNLTTPSTGSDASNKTYVDGQTLNGIATRTASTADITVSGFRITNLGTPSNGTDAVTKTYADALISGVSSWKTGVRAATTVTGTLASAYANGQVIDGVTLATGDRILLKNQTTGGENGIYIVAASGAPTRTTDADAGSELVAAGVWVDEGTTQADSGWIQTTAGPITIGTTATVWVQFSGAGQITSGAGLTKTGNTLDVGAGTGIVVAADSVGIDTTDSNTRVVRRFAADCAAATTTVVTHNLNTLDVIVQVYVTGTTGTMVDADVAHTTVNTATITFATAPTAAQFRIVCVG